jgi:hypothetical protein
MFPQLQASNQCTKIQDKLKPFSGMGPIFVVVPQHWIQPASSARSHTTIKKSLLTSNRMICEVWCYLLLCCCITYHPVAVQLLENVP